MQTLLEVLAEIRRLDHGKALRFHNGFRTWRLSSGDLYRDIGAFAGYLDRAGIHKGDRAIFWAENRPEWVSAFWGCVARGVHVVPVDFRSSIDLVKRIQHDVQARLIVTGDSVACENLDVPQLPVSSVRRASSQCGVQAGRPVSG